MRQLIAISLAVSFLVAGCVTHEPVRGTDPTPYLSGAAGGGPIEAASFEYENPNASLRWPDPLPPEAMAGIDADYAESGALPGSGDEVAGFTEEYGDYGGGYADDYDDYDDGFGGRRRPGHRPGDRPGHRPPGNRPNPPDGGGARPPGERPPPDSAGPDEPEERRQKAREAPKRPERSRPTSPPARRRR